jgi:hypothetical protein
MVALPQSFNTADVEDGDFEPVQPGEYEAMILESEMKATKDGNGAYVQLKIQLKNGRILFERLNIQNKNEQAVEIAYRTLKKICEACGKTSIKDTTELHNKRMLVVLEIEKGKPYEKDGVTKEGRDQNRIKAYKSINGGVAESASGNAAPSTPAANTPPWKR